MHPSRRSGAYVTKLVEDLVTALVKKGYSVASVKHTPHSKSIDCEGKDTWRHWTAGSDPVVFSSNIETSIIKHSKMPLGEIADIVMTRFAPDVLIIEGCKEGAFPKVAALGTELRRGVSTKADVQRIIGLPSGTVGALLPGFAERSSQLDAYQVWYYEDIELTGAETGGDVMTMQMRQQILMSNYYL